MAINPLTDHFAAFFKNINPSPSYVSTAASEHSNVRKLLEDRSGPASELEVASFLQGSYKQDTAIHSINDVDIVALCSALSQPGSQSITVRSWSRDEIFAALQAALLKDHRYRGKIQFGPQSLCIKLNLEIKVEILPAVLKSGITDTDKEPFRIYRPEEVSWSDAYARYHQGWLTYKNSQAENFKPMIKVMKHMRDIYQNFVKTDAISFHVECLLYAIPNNVFDGSPADYIPRVIRVLANFQPLQAKNSGIKNPCGDKVLFSEEEWSDAAYIRFNQWVSWWADKAEKARDAYDRDIAITGWQDLIGNWFPRTA